MPIIDIENIHDSVFRQVLSEPANAETFLQVVLPKDLFNQLDLTTITFDSTSYVSEEYKRSFSDLVVQFRIKAENIPVDVYFLFEHKSYQDEGVFLQLLGYMYAMWKKDRAAKKPLRVIVPVVFYHGEGNWRPPTQFIEQFAIAEEWKGILLNFTYILFDTHAWNWQDESSRPLRENVYLFSAMLLMKAAFSKNMQLIRQVFQLWHQMGFTKEKERVTFLLIYVTATQDIPAAQLEEMLKETKLQGEDVMPTLAQRWIDEGKLKGIQEGIQEGKREGMQQALMMLLTTRFQLDDAEKQFISAVHELEKLSAALKLVVTAQTKDEVLKSLHAVVH